MVTQTNRTRFSALSIGLHWLMLLLIVGGLCIDGTARGLSPGQ